MGIANTIGVLHIEMKRRSSPVADHKLIALFSGPWRFRLSRSAVAKANFGHGSTAQNHAQNRNQKHKTGPHHGRIRGPTAQRTASTTEPAPPSRRIHTRRRPDAAVRSKSADRWCTGGGSTPSVTVDDAAEGKSASATERRSTRRRTSTRTLLPTHMAMDGAGRRRRRGPHGLHNNCKRSVITSVFRPRIQWLSVARGPPKRPPTPTQGHSPLGRPHGGIVCASDRWQSMVRHCKTCTPFGI